MANQMLFVGIAGGLAVAMGLALLLSTVFTQSTAQMMNHQGMMGGSMGPGMMNSQSSGANWQWDQRSMFSANGMSTVSNVQVIGVSITGDDEVAVDLRYTGSGASPAVTIIAMTNHMSMMLGSSGMGGMGTMHGSHDGMMPGNQHGMMQSGMGGWASHPAWQNNTQWQQWHAQMAQWHGQLNSTQWGQMQAWHNEMMAQGAMGPGNPWWNGTSAVWGSHSGVLQSQTGSSVLDAGWISGSVTVKLEGAGSAYESKDLHVMVFQLTS